MKHVLSLGSIMLACAAQATPGDDWPTCSHDKGGQRASSLTDNTSRNADKLTVVWVFT